MKVTWLPVHTVFADAAIERLTGRRASTVITTGRLPAGFPLTQVVSEEVSTQLSTSPF